MRKTLLHLSTKPAEVLFSPLALRGRKDYVAMKMLVIDSGLCGEKTASQLPPKKPSLHPKTDQCRFLLKKYHEKLMLLAAGSSKISGRAQGHGEEAHSPWYCCPVRAVWPLRLQGFKEGEADCFLKEKKKKKLFSFFLFMCFYFHR